ncbi:unnamed protein product [Brassica rapa]|uniref:Uncharacterized protein n=1 Tax=Brassica campestris TaxID=3711 RepID=A0A8D9LRG5_BRACM|nr:unnamed protein product [Brassica rapa]
MYTEYFRSYYQSCETYRKIREASRIDSHKLIPMWFRDKREKEQQRLCKIQRDDDAVTSQAPQEPTTPNAGDALRKTPSYHQSMIWIDQFCRFLLLRIIYEQAVIRSVKTENQDAFQRLLPFDIGKSLFPKGVWFCYPLFVQV